MSYATETTVSVERTRAEIESTLARYGATRFAYATEEKRAVIGFVLKNMGVRFELPLPDRLDQRFWFTPARKNKRSDQEAYREWEQACRSLWRSLYLCIKSKLEACDSHITTFEAEFMCHIVLPTGETFGQMAIPQLVAMRDSGKAPKLQIGWNQ